MLGRVTRETFARGAGRLKIVARFGVGFDTIDVPACTENGVLLTIAPDGVRRPVAVNVITFILVLAQRLFAKDRLTRAGRWAEKVNYMGMGVTGRTLGAIGMGNIGAEVFRLAPPFGMRHIAYDPYVEPGEARALGVELVDLDTLLRTADFVSVMCPLNDETRGMIGARELALMKPTAYLINTARGPIVQETGAPRRARGATHRRRCARRLRGRADAGRQPDPRARQRRRHAARVLLHRRVPDGPRAQRRSPACWTWRRAARRDTS